MNRLSNPVAKIFSPNGVDIGRRLVLAGGPGLPAVTRRTTSMPKRGPQGQAGDGRGRFVNPLDVARMVNAAARAGTHSSCRWHQAAGALKAQEWADSGRVRRPVPVFQTSET